MNPVDFCCDVMDDLDVSLRTIRTNSDKTAARVYFDVDDTFSAVVWRYPDRASWGVWRTDEGSTEDCITSSTIANPADVANSIRAAIARLTNGATK